MQLPILPLDTRVNEFLTNYRNDVYELPVTPSGSFGKRVQSRPSRGGSCFFNAYNFDPGQHISRTTNPRALLKIHYYQKSAVTFSIQRRTD